jgi:integrase
LFHWFLENWCKPRKRSWETDQHRWNAHLKSWASRRLPDIAYGDVATLHQRISHKSSGTTANRVVALLSTMFNKGRRQFEWNMENPCRGIEKFSEKSRERFLSADELKRFFAALDKEPNQDWRDFFRVALYTGARRTNALSMRWDELDLANAQWAIPGSKFKNGRAQIVHLAPPVVDILKGRKGNNHEWVFPSPESGHLRKPYRPWRNLCRRAELSDLRIHDLRRTLGSWQAADGASLPVIGKSLGHTTAAATAVYARLELAPIRASVNSAVAAMAATASGEEITLTAAESRALDRANDFVGGRARREKRHTKH